MSDLLQNQQWVGMFFPKGNEQNRFCGELSYSPEEGLLLKYESIGDTSVNILHGFIMYTGEPCTLIIETPQSPEDVKEFDRMMEELEEEFGSGIEEFGIRRAGDRDQKIDYLIFPPIERHLRLGETS